MNRQIGVKDFKYAGRICPLCIGHVIRRMRTGCKRIVNGILVIYNPTGWRGSLHHIIVSDMSINQSDRQRNNDDYIFSSAEITILSCVEDILLCRKLFCRSMLSRLKMPCVKCTAMRRTVLLQLLSWKPSAAVVICLCLASVATVGDASYEKTCTTEDRLRPRGICGQQLTVLISTLCQSRYNKRNAAAGSRFTSLVMFVTSL